MARGAEFEPSAKDRLYVRSMSAAGIPQEKIAQCLGIGDKTLRKHFPDELNNAESELVSDAVKYLARAIKGDICKEGVTAAIFIAKTRGGWRETGAIDTKPEPLEPSTVVIKPAKGE